MKKPPKGLIEREKRLVKRMCRALEHVGADPAVAFAFLNTGMLCDEAGLATYAKRQPALCTFWRQEFGKWRRKNPGQSGSDFPSMADVLQRMSDEGKHDKSYMELAAAAALMYGTGFVLREIMMLDVSDIDLKNGTVMPPDLS